jgi:hypothetical protein
MGNPFGPGGSGAGVLRLARRFRPTRRRATTPSIPAIAIHHGTQKVNWWKDGDLHSKALMRAHTHGRDLAGSGGWYEGVEIYG